MELTVYCKCVHPLLDVDQATCRRCRLEVTPFRRTTEMMVAGSIRAELFPTLDDGLTLQGGDVRR